MRRRELMVLAGGAALAWAPSVRAKQGTALRRVGYLNPSTRSLLSEVPRDAFVAALGERGWKEGFNLSLDWRYSNDIPALAEKDADEMVASSPDVLFGGSSAAIELFRKRTHTIPIVFTQVTDPVGQGFVASLAKPGGNITGFSNYDAPMVTKWLTILAQITPKPLRVAALFNPATAPYAGLYLRALKAAAPSFGMTIEEAPVHDDAEIETAIAGLTRGDPGGLLVLPDTFTTSHATSIVVDAAHSRVPAVYPFPFFASSGGLIAYGVDPNDLFRRAADYVDRILRGAVPADLPVQAPTKFILVVNLKTAKALGMTVGPSLLPLADQVIE